MLLRLVSCHLLQYPCSPIPCRPNHDSCVVLHVYTLFFFIMICQSPTVHIVLQKWSLSFLNWCPGGCCHVTAIFRYSSDLLRWYSFPTVWLFSSLISSAEEKIFCHLWQLDKERLQSHFPLSIFLLGSIMNKQYFRWLTSKKCFLSNSCQDFGTQGKTFSVSFLYLWRATSLSMIPLYWWSLPIEFHDGIF